MFTVLFAIGRLPGWIAHWRKCTLIRRNELIGLDKSTPATTKEIFPIEKRG